MRTHGVQCLLMGGQACIVYGAAEFSRDADLAVLADTDNLRRLAQALADLRAETIAVPPFEADYLQRGHAVHFRCAREDVRGLRVDVMSRMRGVEAFPTVWERRTTIALRVAPEDQPLDVDILSLPDLVAAKKTQRDKDWPMIRRLVEVNWFEFRDQLTDDHIAFWLRELRTSELLLECVDIFPDEANALANSREAVTAALDGDLVRVERALTEEQERERKVDLRFAQDDSRPIAHPAKTPPTPHPPQLHSRSRHTAPHSPPDT